MSRNGQEQKEPVDFIEKFAGKTCSSIVNGRVNQRAIKTGSGSSHTIEVQGITFSFADGSKVKIDNFWGNNISALGELVTLFATYCKIFNSDCDHNLRPDNIITI